MPHNAAAMRSHCGGVPRKSILTGESFYLIVLHLPYLGYEGVARQAEAYDRTGAAFSLITRHVLFTIEYPTPIMYYRDDEGGRSVSYVSRLIGEWVTMRVWMEG